MMYYTIIIYVCYYTLHYSYTLIVSVHVYMFMSVYDTKLITMILSESTKKMFTKDYSRCNYLIILFILSTKLIVEFRLVRIIHS